LPLELDILAGRTLSPESSLEFVVMVRAEMDRYHRCEGLL
jgi:hypothetical protein